MCVLTFAVIFHSAINIFQISEVFTAGLYDSTFSFRTPNPQKFRFPYTLYLEGTQSLKVGINLEPLMMIVKLMTKLSKPQGSLKETVLLGNQ